MNQKVEEACETKNHLTNNPVEEMSEMRHTRLSPDGKRVVSANNVVPKHHKHKGVIITAHPNPRTATNTIGNAVPTMSGMGVNMAPQTGM